MLGETLEVESEHTLRSHPTYVNDDDDAMPTETEISGFMAILAEGNPNRASLAISFFENCMSVVTPEMLRRVLELGGLGDVDIAISAVSFLQKSVESGLDVRTDGVVQFLIRVMTTYSGEVDVLSSALETMRVFCEKEDSGELFVSLVRDYKIFASVLPMLGEGCDLNLLASCLRLLNAWFQDPKLVNGMKNAEFEMICVGKLLELLRAGNEAVRSLALNSLRYFCMNCDEAAVNGLMAGGLVECLGSASSAGPKMLTYVLMALLPITALSDKIVMPLIPVIDSILNNGAVLAKMNDRALLHLATILQNLVARDSDEIKRWVLTAGPINFLLVLLEPRRSSLMKQGVKVLCFVAIGNPAQFVDLMTSRPTIMESITVMVTSDDENVVESCMDCILCLCRYVSSAGGNILSILNDDLISAVQTIQDECGSTRQGKFADGIIDLLNDM